MSGERIAIAQVPSFRGDIARNFDVHAQAMHAAHERGAALVLFPELSLTGYEPDLAAGLAMRVDDARLHALVGLARDYRMSAVVGAPLRSGNAKPYLGAIIISAAGTLSTYHKMYLGGDEPAYFEPGGPPKVLPTAEHKVGLAICADTSRRSHLDRCIVAGADVYAAGVFLTREWYEADSSRLKAFAKRHGILTMMANQGASIGTLESWGNSAAWGPDGELLAHAPGTESALVIASKPNNQWHAACVLL